MIFIIMFMQVMCIHNETTFTLDTLVIVDNTIQSTCKHTYIYMYV